MTTKAEQQVIDRVKRIGISAYIKEVLEDHDFKIDNQLISKEPWLFDPELTDEERMLYKLKGKCHVCGLDTKFHRDDCPYSMNQLYFAELETIDGNLKHINTYINSIIGELNFNIKK